MTSVLFRIALVAWAPLAAAAQPALRRAAVPTAVAPGDSAPPGVMARSLPGGLRVALVPLRSDGVRVELALRVGTRDERVSGEVRRAAARLAERVGGGACATVGEYETVLALDARPADVPAALRRLADAMVADDDARWAPQRARLYVAGRIDTTAVLRTSADAFAAWTRPGALPAMPLPHDAYDPSRPRVVLDEVLDTLVARRLGTKRANRNAVRRELARVVAERPAVEEVRAAARAVTSAHAARDTTLAGRLAALRTMDLRAIDPESWAELARLRAEATPQRLRAAARRRLR